MKIRLTFILLLVSIAVFAQGDITSTKTYPSNYFSNPLEIPLILSGTFGELRPNHFHTGLDIKTQQREGLNVLAAAKGYVARIKISHWGYGKAIYIAHPNGYTTVYAHLQKFNDRIENYIKKRQYKKESFEIQLFPSASELPITQGEIIALSGSSGGSSPHLHFEIRDTGTEKTINPLHFGIDIPDTIKPRINNLMGYSLSENSHINGITAPSQLVIKTLSNGDLKADQVTAFGKIGFGINSYDQLNGASNKNGLYSLELFVNGKPINEFRTDETAFSEGKYINLYIDYERYAKLGQRVQKCFVDPSSKLDMYPISVNKGSINIEDGLNYTVEIVSKDFKGNIKKITIPILGKKDVKIISEPIKTTAYKIIHTNFQKFEKDGISVAFPKNTFYNDFYLDFEVSNNIVKVHTPTVPLNNRYTITFDVSKFSSEQKKKLYIASINKKGSKYYEKTVKKENTFYSSTKKLGKFTLLSDNTKPKISLVNFNDKQWLSNAKTLKVKISDSESGIKSYRGEIDGEWILMEYNVKNGVLTYNLSEKAFTTAEHQFKIVATDNVGNTTTLNTSFFRKK